MGFRLKEIKPPSIISERMMPVMRLKKGRWSKFLVKGTSTSTKP